jgi:DnaJ-class molecular chaperone
MEYHPDRAKGDKKQAESKFKEIGEAYETLSDSSKRKNYDMFGSSKSNPF